MRLKLLRWLEKVFEEISYYFENWADSIDTELHEILRSALKEEVSKIINKPEEKE